MKINRDEILAANPISQWLLDRGVKLTEGGKRADRCPLKEHSRADTVSVDAGKNLFHCHACNIGGTVIDWLATEKNIPPVEAMRELAGTNGSRASTAKPKIVTTYDYTDEGGKLIYQVCRFFPKTFKQRRPDGSGKWVWKVAGVRRVLYRLPAVIEADRVIVTEGERDVETHEALGFTATTSSGGAGKWLQEYSETLRGKEIIICGDNDPRGLEHITGVARSLHGVAASVKIITLPDTVNGQPVKDVTDFVEAIGNKETARSRLQELIDMAKDCQLSAVAGNVVTANAIQSAPNDSPASKYGPPLIGDGEHQTINQAHFAARYVSDSGIVHDPPVRRFFLYDPITGLWKHQTDEVTVREIGLCFQRIVTEADCPHLLAKRTSNMLHGLRDLARGISERRDVFNQRGDAIHVVNGMLVLGDGGSIELKPFAPEWYSRNRSEFAWNPAADCPRFKNELLLSAMPAEDAGLVQRYFGQCLLGVNISQTFLVLRGMAGGGKTTLANIIEGIIGRHNVTELRIAQLCERFELVRFVGRTLLSGKDVPGDFLNMKPAHVLKALVGGDTLEGEVKHGNESFSIEGRFNVLISTNTRLRVKLDSDAGAWRRRMLIVDYARPKPTKPIPGFDSILLREEGEGILRWAVEGAIQLKTELDATGVIQLSDAQRRRVDDLLSESDSVRSFVRERVEQHHGAEIAIHELTAAYRDYCDARDWEPLRDRQFQAELPDAMLEYHRATKRNDICRDGKSVRGFRGVRFQASPAGAPEPPEPQGHDDGQLPLSDASDDHRGIIPREQENDTEGRERNIYITSGQASDPSELTPATTAERGRQ